MISMSGGAALVRLLAPERVPFVFGVAGGKLVQFMRALAQQDAIRYVGTRHEAAGGHMAAAVYAATGRMAVAMGEVGPGAGNLLAAVASAYNNNVPMLALTSNNQQCASYPGRGMLMEMDTAAVFRPVTKWNAVVHDARRLPELVRTAFREALTGRPGPVHLDVPQDVLNRIHEFDEAVFEMPPSRYRVLSAGGAAPEQIDEAAQLLLGARRVLVVAGGGASMADASGELRALTHALGAAATATQMGIGAIDSEAPGFVGHGGVIGGPAIVQAFAEADVILAVGCRFSSWLWNEHGAMVRPDQKLIHVDSDPGIIGRNADIALGIVGDAKVVTRQLVAALGKGRGAADPAWLDNLAHNWRAYREQLHALAASPPSAAGLMHPAALAAAVGEALPHDALATFDGGHTSFWSNDLTPARAPRTRFHEPGMAQLGFGLPAALALKLAFPDRPVFNLTGDGAFGFSIAELDTARRYGLNVINVVHNNSAWGVIRAGQQRNEFELGCELGGTEYARIAEGFGCHGEIVTSIEQLPHALERAMTSGLPAVLDCRVSFEPHPSFAAFGRSTSLGMHAKS
ncbi:thiamine pyrophosphate-binding protein [Paraburkholderia sp. J67]|uniref:thiamine pyrophosphate-binding protein n=1 Tax=Paraburkholderia sp. J67 TaxID=2805435 RepID=UPI002ABE3D2C|nr:thiamine pyrophosphate-binding protein [Paraburkholderia sp. J67]